MTDQVKTLRQYTDDLWTSTEFEERPFNELLKEFSLYAHFTGLKINYDKTEILCIGALRNSDAKFYSNLPLHWSDGLISVLAIVIHSNFAQIMMENYTNL